MFTRVENMTCNLRFEINVVSFKVDLRERVKLFLPKLANVFGVGLHGTDVALALLTQRPSVRIPALPRFFLCCLVCG